MDIKYNLYINIMSKEDIISKIYNDPAGFGSIRETYLEARKKDPTIKYDDVRSLDTQNR